MNNLLSAIMTKTTGSALSTDVNGRIFIDRAPEETEFPYVVFNIVSNVTDNVFNTRGEDILFQFSLFSASDGLTEITDMYADLKTLFDDAQFEVTDNYMVVMQRKNMVAMTEDLTTTSGMQKVKHWAVDYQILLQSDTDGPYSFASWLSSVTSDGTPPESTDGLQLPTHTIKVTINGAEYELNLTQK